MTKRATSYWEVEIYAECPHCEHTWEITHDCEFKEQYAPAAICEGKKGIQMTCPECSRGFILDVERGT